MSGNISSLIQISKNLMEVSNFWWRSKWKKKHWYSPQVNTGSRVISTAAPEVNTATSEGLMEQIPTTEDIQVEDQDIELGNISPSYEVSSTPHTRIHHSRDHQLIIRHHLMDLPRKELCESLIKLMKDKFQMSSMGELTFFLGLQVQQKKKGIFISQDKYVHEILRKFNYTDVKSASTPTDLERPLVKDADADDVSPKTSISYLSKEFVNIPQSATITSSWYLRFSIGVSAYTDRDMQWATLDSKVNHWSCQFWEIGLISWSMLETNLWLPPLQLKARICAAAEVAVDKCSDPKQLLD
ncbi:uncharacterized mitochondrial protein-like protein [Tanacetum coccineum]